MNNQRDLLILRMLCSLFIGHFGAKTFLKTQYLNWSGLLDLYETLSEDRKNTFASSVLFLLKTHFFQGSCMWIIGFLGLLRRYWLLLENNFSWRIVSSPGPYISRQKRYLLKAHSSWWSMMSLATYSRKALCSRLYDPVTSGVIACFVDVSLFIFAFVWRRIDLIDRHWVSNFTFVDGDCLQSDFTTSYGPIVWCCRLS